MKNVEYLWTFLLPPHQADKGEQTATVQSV